VLVVDNDGDIAALVHMILKDEDFDVAVLHDQTSDAIRGAVACVKPDCILLDGMSSAAYGESWADAAWAAQREPAVPVIMFTASTQAVAEAQAEESERSRAANFASVLPKPFNLDQLLGQVTRAVEVARRYR
jgi:DNA-binding response OmpR family regulator